MDRTEMMMRLGYYCGMAARAFGDCSYALRCLGRGETITEAEYLEITQQIQARLLAARLIQPDEDPYEAYLSDRAQTPAPEPSRLSSLR